MEQLSQNGIKNNISGTSYNPDLLPLSTHGILIEYKLIRFYNKKQINTEVEKMPKTKIFLNSSLH